MRRVSGSPLRGAELFCGPGWPSPHPGGRKVRASPAVHRAAVPRADLGFSPERPQAVHIGARAAHMRSAGWPQDAHRSAHIRRKGDRTTNRPWVQPGSELWTGMWTTVDGCGRNGGGPKLSTTRPEQSPITSRVHPHRMRPRHLLKRQLSPQPTALTTTADLFFPWKKKKREVGAVDKWTTGRHRRGRMPGPGCDDHAGRSTVELPRRAARSSSRSRLLVRDTLRARSGTRSRPTRRAGSTARHSSPAAEPRLNPKGHP